MKITDVLQSDKITLSMEVFPPKTTTAVEKVNEAVREIAALKPDFMSVTYGAAGGKTVNTQFRLHRTLRIHTVSIPSHI